ncbi:YihY/virulence factor BrkB family protein [Campylobacter troglodytis]|uniref:YihY/virulence factor BrkB family protein n=1 Tax=Campylobacter troglodytis TaxID=654363 RepID=UPI001159AB99|nr:YihY/virulence factor BrkB family protein [Campylobacter troglodytis]TQR61086.1 hypothetical protein DMC01_02835 [Campylobacter troglodytis]
MGKLKQLWFFVLLFKDKEIMLFSAALSFYTVLSLIPLLFVGFSIFTQIPSFQIYYDKMKGLIFNFLIPTQQELISSYLDSFLKNSVNLGIVGFVAMIFTSLAFFSSYDYVINRISKNEPKTLWQSISSYWTLVTLTPLGLGLSFYVSSFIQKTLDEWQVSFNILELLPFLIIWGLFFVAFSSSLNKGSLKMLSLSSFVSAAIWYISKNLFIYYVVYNKTYTNVYGSFSTLLFFFLWLYISWVIYLFGLKAYYHLDQPVPVKKSKKTS